MATKIFRTNMCCKDYDVFQITSLGFSNCLVKKSRCFFEVLSYTYTTVVPNHQSFHSGTHFHPSPVVTHAPRLSQQARHPYHPRHPTPASAGIVTLMLINKFDESGSPSLWSLRYVSFSTVTIKTDRSCKWNSSIWVNLLNRSDDQKPWIGVTKSEPDE